MPEYLYRCKTHGTVSVRKPMAEAGSLAFCHGCEADYWPYRSQPMQRLYNSSAIIMRPDGWNLRPGEPGYSARRSFAREKELGQLRTITTASEDRTVLAEAAAEDWPDPSERSLNRASEHGLQQISEWAQHNTPE